MLISTQWVEISIQQGAGKYCLIVMRIYDCEEIWYQSYSITIEIKSGDFASAGRILTKFPIFQI